METMWLGNVEYIFGMWTAVTRKFGVKRQAKNVLLPVSKTNFMETFMFVGLSSFYSEEF